MCGSSTGLDSRGMTEKTSIVVLAVLAFLAGSLLVANLYQVMPEEDGTGGNGGDWVSESEYESLRRRVDFLENMWSGDPGASENFWPVEEIYRTSKPSVVQIRAISVTSGFFGEETQTSQGSGFVYDVSGHIITNHHVIEGTDEIQVRFCNGETVEAVVSGSDPYSDLAVLELKELSDLDSSLYPLSLGDSSSLYPGSRVLAVGSPFGLEGTATFGIVSQTERVISTGTDYLIPGVIQIDAPINPGNSGGPLLDMRGKVVGITTAIESQTGTFSGIGYVVPSDLVRRVVEGVIENGEYHHPKLGITGRDVTYGIAQERGMDRVRGFHVDSVEEGGPSDGEVQSGDIILEIDNDEVMGIEDILSHIVLEKSPGEVVSLKVLRDGETVGLEVELDVRPAA